MDRLILHSDCNCFYASVEMLHHPELEGKPLAVGGDPQERHGIVLTANYNAKRRGVKTGMALWRARQACPDVVFVPPRMELYLRFSEMVHEIYSDYTDLQEPFGIDECWLDVTGCTCCRGEKQGEEIAQEIRSRVKKELGITVSVGVSWNKIFAKLGSDYKKPDAVTVFSRDNYKDLVWSQPVENLLYVGRATQRKLRKYGIVTIGDLAGADPSMLETEMGKMGRILSAFARGEDRTPVSRENTQVPIKSIGNSTTAPRDLVNNEDVSLVLYLLCESVAGRLRDHGLAGDVVGICVRDTDLGWADRQKRISAPTSVSGEIHGTAMKLFRELYSWEKPVRSIGVRMSGLHPRGFPCQLDLFRSEETHRKYLRADETAQEIRRRFGFWSIQRGIMLKDPYLASLNASSDEHMIHPHSYMERGNRTGI